MSINIMLTYAYFFIVGTVFGSFCMLVGQRVPKKLSIIKPRSHCSDCGHQLGIGELIPIVSYFLIGRKCKQCGAKLSIVYPLIECLTGLAFAVTPWLLSWHWETLVCLTMVCLLVIISVSDITTRLIPNKILVFFLGVVVVERLFIPLNPWWSSILGAVIGFGLLFLLGYLSKGGMGGGDIKLFGVLGLFLGWQGTLITLVVASVLGLIYGLYQLIRKVDKSRYIPFGPFIAIGAYLSYFVLSGQFDRIRFIINEMLT